MRITIQTVKAKAVEKIVDLWRRKDVEAVKEDARKVGTVLLGGGFIGVVIGADSISFSEGILLLVTGFVIGFFGMTGGKQNGRI